MKNSKDENQPEYTESQKKILRSLELLAQNAPKGGYARALKNKYFKPKTNWTMLAAIIGLAALVLAAIQVLG